MKKTYIAPETIMINTVVETAILGASDNSRQTIGEGGSYDIGGGVTVIGDNTSDEDDDDEGGALGKCNPWSAWDDEW